jgi:hypothetical protein
MNTLEFLSLVTPRKGQKAIVVRQDFHESPAKCRWVHHVHDDHSSMVDRITSLNEKAIYFALAGFKSRSINTFSGRSQSNVEYLRSFWFDIDVEENNSKKYSKKSTAAAALGEFIDKYDLPEPLIVRSGGGLHVYWPLDQDISLDEWLPVANALKAAANTFGLLVDHSRTTDSASILRPVGTYNNKTDKPRQVVAIKWDGKPCELLALSKSLGYETQAINFDGFNGENLRLSADSLINLSVNTSSQLIPIDKLSDMSAWINAKSAANYFKTKSESHDGYDLWLRSLLLPLKNEATKRPNEACSIKAIFDKACDKFDVSSNTDHNTALWSSTQADSTTIATYIAIANFAGYVDRETEELQQDDLIDRLNQEYAFVDIGGKVSIIGEKLDINFGYKKLTFSTVRQFRELHGEPFFFSDSAGKVRKTTRADFWLQSAKRRRCDNFAFLPAMDAPNSCFNFWRGWGVIAKKGVCNLYLHHVRNIICDGDEAKYKLLMQFLAHAVQRPFEKPGFMVVLIGNEGTGKGQFVHGVGAIFGAHYQSQLDSKALTGQFNGELGDAIFCFADEVTLTGQSNETERFKKLITEPFFRLERKGHDAYELRSFHRFILATNSEHAVRAGASARRFYVLRMSTTVQQNHRYFEALRNELDHGGREALHYHLRHEVDISDFDHHKAPATDELLEQKLLSLSAVDNWIFDQLVSGELWREIDKPCEINARILALRISDETGQKTSDPRVASRIKQLFKIESSTFRSDSGNRSRVWALPPLLIARQLFTQSTSIPIPLGDK